MVSLRARGSLLCPSREINDKFYKENTLGKIELVTRLDWCAVHEGYNGVIVPEITNLTEWLRASTEFRPAYPDGCVVRNEMSTYGKVSQQYSQVIFEKAFFFSAVVEKSCLEGSEAVSVESI